MAVSIDESLLPFVILKERKINNEGVDENIDSFQGGGSFNGGVRRSFPLYCE